MVVVLLGLGCPQLLLPLLPGPKVAEAYAPFDLANFQNEYACNNLTTRIVRCVGLCERGPRVYLRAKRARMELVPALVGCAAEGPAASHQPLLECDLTARGAFVDKR